MTAQHPIRALLEALGHLGVWAGAYSTAALIWFLQMSGLQSAPVASLVCSVFLTATAAYALDRVKLRSTWIDPADVQSQPARYAFLTRHATAVRVGAGVCIVLAAFLGLETSRWAPLAVVMGAAGVVAYAPKPRATRPRPKDVPWLKNAYVAFGIAGFVGVAGLAAHARFVVGPSRVTAGVSITDLVHGLIQPAAAFSLAILVFRVVVDAALCDLDDADTDAKFGTRTFATLLGSRRLWVYTGLARCVIIGLTFAAVPCPWHRRLVWGVATIIGTIAIRARRPSRVRDAIDVRFAAEAVMTTTAIRLLMW